MEFSHFPVMLNECIKGLNVREDGTYVDGTAGGGGHSSEIAKRLTTGRLFPWIRIPMPLKRQLSALAFILRLRSLRLTSGI